MANLLTSVAVGALTMAFVPVGRKSHNYPPGPKPHPVIGHMLQVPQDNVWTYFEQLGKEYGPMVKVNLAGDDIIILNTPEDAEELLGRRSQYYSSRKPLIYAGKHRSSNKRLVLLEYGSMLKKQRQAFHGMLQPRIVGSYENMQLQQSSKLLFDMLQAPKVPFVNVKRFGASLLCMLCYGRHLSDDDGDLKQLLEITASFLDDCRPGKHLVDVFPFLDSPLIPDWLASWRGEAKKSHDNEIAFYSRLLNEVKARMDAGDTDKARLECFAARLWDQKDKLELDEECMAYVAGSAFEAGTGNVAGSILFYLQAMVNHPHVLKRAQAEIDALLGPDSDTPPTFEHIDRLPYCVALCKEIIRWIPAAPGSFPHFSTKEDEYKGYTIHEGTRIIPNVWMMHRDENRFKDATKFIPERWLRPDEEKYSEHDSLTEGHWGFGFGRRTCPGLHLASKSIWIVMTQLSWGFNITNALDASGNPIPVDPYNLEWSVTIEPKQFPMTITPRSLKHKAIIERVWAEAESHLV